MTRRRLAILVGVLGLASLLAVLLVQRRDWRHVTSDPAEGRKLVSACRGLMASIAPNVSLSWGYGAQPNSVALPDEVTGLSPSWVIADRNQVQMGWPEGRGAPTLYRGLIIYAEGAEPSGTSRSETGHGHFRSEKASDALWTFESQGDA